jgi:UDP-N-acetylmuramyl pentapeptide synthase
MVIVELKAPVAVDGDAMFTLLKSVKFPKAKGGRRERVAILLDVTEVCDYAMEAHAVLIEWLKCNGDRIYKVAVMIDHAIWDSLVSVLAKEVATVWILPFQDKNTSFRWIEEERARPT